MIQATGSISLRHRRISHTSTSLQLLLHLSIKRNHDVLSCCSFRAYQRRIGFLPRRQSCTIFEVAFIICIFGAIERIECNRNSRPHCIGIPVDWIWYRQRESTTRAITDVIINIQYRLSCILINSIASLWSLRVHQESLSEVTLSSPSSTLGVSPRMLMRTRWPGKLWLF